MSNNNIVPKTRSNDEEESSIKMEKSNLQSTQPRMTAEQQQEVLCNESGREGGKCLFILLPTLVKGSRIGARHACECLTTHSQY